MVCCSLMVEYMVDSLCTKKKEKIFELQPLRSDIHPPFLMRELKKMQKASTLSHCRWNKTDEDLLHETTPPPTYTTPSPTLLLPSQPSPPPPPLLQPQPQPQFPPLNGIVQAVDCQTILEMRFVADSLERQMATAVVPQILSVRRLTPPSPALR